MQGFNSEFAGMGVVVLGGAVGSGPDVVQGFVDMQAKVVVGEFAGEASTAPKGNAIHLPIGGRSERDIRDFFDNCEKHLGAIEILVLVAPPIALGAALSISEETYRSVIDQELLTPILCIRDAARRMTSRNYGRIVSLVSMSGKTGVHKNVSPYAAAKGGLVTFSRAIASEVAADGVTVNAIAVSLFEVQVPDPADQAKFFDGIPVRRLGQAQDIVSAVLYLTSRNAGYVTGETLNLSGGRFMD